MTSYSGHRGMRATRKWPYKRILLREKLDYGRRLRHYLSQTVYLLCGHNTHCTIQPTLCVNPAYLPSILSALIRTSQASHRLLSRQSMHVWTSTNSLYPTPSNISATDTHSPVNNSTPIPEPNPYPNNSYPMMRCTLSGRWSDPANSIGSLHHVQFNSSFTIMFNLHVCTIHIYLISQLT